MNTKTAAVVPAQVIDAAGAERPTTVRWRIFLILLLLSAINYIDRASLSVALPLISTEFEMTPALEGLMLSAFFWSYALMQIPGGMLLDRFGNYSAIFSYLIICGILATVCSCLVRTPVEEQAKAS